MVNIFQQQTLTNRGNASLISTNAVLRNTYLLLSLTLISSAIAALFAMMNQVAPINPIITIIFMFGLSFLTTMLRNSIWGIVSIFAFTSFMGYTLGPILNMISATYINGSQIIFTSLGSTGLIFLLLSAYVMTTQKDFNYMSGMLFASAMVLFLCSIASIIFHMPAFSLIISGGFAMLSCGFILFHTSQIIHGGERNYIIATINIYMSLFNLFMSLLNILTALAGRRE